MKRKVSKVESLYTDVGGGFVPAKASGFCAVKCVVGLCSKVCVDVGGGFVPARASGQTHRSAAGLAEKERGLTQILKSQHIYYAKKGQRTHCSTPSLAEKEGGLTQILKSQSPSISFM